MMCLEDRSSLHSDPQKFCLVLALDSLFVFPSKHNQNGGRVKHEHVACFAIEFFVFVFVVVVVL